MLCEGIICDLLWSDPDKNLEGWGENDRGVSFTFGGDVVAKFLKKHDLDLVCRAHQVVEDGYEFFAKRRLVTIFSAPNYCGEFDNAGAMMSVDETLMCSFQVEHWCVGDAVLVVLVVLADCCCSVSGFCLFCCSFSSFFPFLIFCSPVRIPFPLISPFFSSFPCWQ